MKTVSKLFVIFSFVFLTASCGDEAPQYPDLALSPYGVPITLPAPEGSQVEKSDLGGMFTEILIKGSDDYQLQVISNDAVTTNLDSLLGLQKENVRSERYFKEMITEDSDGFVYLRQVDSLNFYDFRHIKVIGEKEYIFQASFLGQFDQSAAEDMYKAAQAGK